eukprot:365071-Chlamydomonas_euryale.AAC.9
MIVIWRQKICELLRPEKPVKSKERGKERVCVCPRPPSGARESRTTRGCLLKGAIDYGPRQRHQTVVVEKSELGQGRASAILMFGRVGVKNAVRTVCCGRQAAGDRRRSRLSAPWIKSLNC